MSEIKSVRVRKITENSNTGSLDLKVVLTSDDTTTSLRTARAVIPSSGQTYWQSVSYEGQRYASKTNDEIISEFVSSNSEIEANRVGSSLGPNLYKIVQDPYSDSVPQLRNFGLDPYYLNNGAYIRIRWQKYLSVSYSFDTTLVYGNGTSSAPTQVLVDSAIFFDSSSPSDLNIGVPNYFELYYNAASYSTTTALSHAQLESQTTGFRENAGEYSIVYPRLDEDDAAYLFPKVGTSSFYTSDVYGYEYSDLNLKEINTPNYIFKTFFIAPRPLKVEVDQNDEIERFWTLDETYQPRFILEVENITQLTQNKPLKFSYNIKDDTIVNTVIENWIKALAASYPVAQSYGLKLNTPSYVPSTTDLIGDFSPKNGYGMKDGQRVFPENTQFKFEAVSGDPNAKVPLIVGSGSSASNTATVTSTQDTVKKEILNFQFPDNWIVKTDEPAPTFSIWIGDIEEDIPVEGFVFSEGTDDLSGLAPEYIEEEFAGLEEVYQEPDPTIADEYPDLDDSDRGSTEITETASTAAATAESGSTSEPVATNNVSIPPSKPDSNSLKDIIKFACESTYSPNGNKKSSGKCARYTFNHANNFVRTLLKKDPQGVSNPAGGNANQEGYFKALERLGYKRFDQGTVTKSNLIKSLGNKSSWNMGDVVCYWGVNAPSNYSDKGGVKYGHTQMFTNGNHGTSNAWTSDNHGNFACSFVYNKYPVDNWRYVIFKSPTATSDGQKKYGVS